MSLILHTGFDDDLNKLREYSGSARLESISPASCTPSQLSAADLILLGPQTPDLVKTVQAISRMDKSISTIVLPAEKDYASLKQSLLFTPYVSKDARIMHFNHQLLEEIPRAAEMTRRRRQFARLSASINSAPPLEASKPVRLEHLGNFLDQAPIGAIILNQHFEVLGMNVFLRRLFDLQPLASVSSLEDLLDKSSVQTIRNYVTRGSRSSYLEIFSRQRYFEVHFAAITNEQAEKLQILLINDITERKLEHQRIRSVLDSLPQMAWTTNAEGEVTYLTNGWYAYTGQSHAMAMGTGWIDVIHDEDREPLLEKWREATQSVTPYEMEARYRRHDNQYRWHLVRGTPMLQSNGKVSFWLGTCTDIQEQKKEQQSLSAQVEERNAELIKVNELLQKSNQDLQQFAFVASHDLKEPVRKIKMFIDQLERVKDPAARQNYVDRLKQSAQRMSELIEGIMAYSQVAGGPDKSQVDLGRVVEKIIFDLEILLKEKEAKVEAAGPLPQIPGDETQLHQLFSNLILNGIKYNERKPLITITARKLSHEELPEVFQKTKKQFYEIRVSDNGIGIDKKYSDSIFEMFKRLHGRDQYSGAGIGLALAKKIVLNHGGYISVQSEPGEGSEFVVGLPGS